ncbi:MAG: LptF/LptG family permease [Alphaproteobacteria bacterium]
MQKILDRYLLTLLSTRMVLISLVLISIVWLTKSIQLFQKVSEGLAPSLIMKLTILSLPPFLVEVIPFALFVTIIMSWSRLILDRELVVMQAAGVSPWRMAYPVIMLGIASTILALFMSISMVPSSYRQLNELEGEIAQYGHLLLNEGAVTEITDNQYIYIETRENNVLKGISIYINDENGNNQQTIVAKEGIVNSDKSGTTWILLVDGKRNVWESNNKSFNTLTFKNYSFEFSPAPSKKRTRKPREANFSVLLNPQKDTTIKPDDYPDYYSEAHKRISGPLLALSYALIALAWMKSGHLLRRGHSQRIFFATLSVIALRAFIFIATILGSTIEWLYGFSYIIIAVSIIIPAYYLIRSSF